jgi:regulation of enolase protein 1 (concanavalin A-like superfamily)
MARESTAAGSKNVFAFAWPSKGYRFSARSTTGGSTVFSGTGATSYPNTWIRLKRVGNTFTAYRSADGINWTTYGTATITMTSTLYVGMAVSSLNTSLATAQFRNLSP